MKVLPLFFLIHFFKILFLLTLIMGTLISISAYSWMSMWMGLEINLLSFIPLISSYKNKFSTESALKYFITQALASIILLFSVIMIMSMNEFLPQIHEKYMILILNSSLLLKMGAAPFHFWFPQVMEGLNWNNNLILLTWQKLAPMILLMYNFSSINFLLLISIISMMIGSFLGLNQSSLRKIMAFSSINHIGWMLMSLLVNQSIWMIYFLVYTFISLSILMMFQILNIFYFSQFSFFLNKNSLIKFFFSLNFLSLGGLPPFIGFFPKWLTLNYILKEKFFLMAFLMILFTLVTLYFYIRLIFSSMTFYSLNSNSFMVNLNTKLINYFTMFSSVSLLGSTIMFNYL
uniref:NADH-ubiquinone oxidoreductase chain 2 n=1 Tax=Cerylon histeroides TaxID=347309 RepID=I7F2X3_9CUCU|nr:NADH dehydrogenase subunit 2 [Cerylon histeroides]